MLTIGSLFSGVGGFELGLEWAGLGPVLWQVERDPWCQDRLARAWPGVDLHADVRNVGAHNLQRVDVVCGGFPCQDVSSAGRRAGLAGKRSGLWSEFARIVGELRPRWALVENVASGASRWVDPVVRELAERGYEAIPIPLSAEDVGAPHRRARIFVVARRVSNADGGELRVGAERRPRRSPERIRDAQEPEPRNLGAIDLADGDGERRKVEQAARLHDRRELGDDASRRRADLWRGWPPGPEDREGWARYLAAGGPEPGVRRGAHGLSAGDRNAALIALGNAIVPQTAHVIGELVLALEREKGHRNP